MFWEYIIIKFLNKYKWVIIGSYASYANISIGPKNRVLLGL